MSTATTIAATGWYYARNGKQGGPVSLAQLKNGAASGKLRPDDMVWHESMPEWVEAAQVPDLHFGGATAAAAHPPAAAAQAPVRSAPVVSAPAPAAYAAPEPQPADDGPGYEVAAVAPTVGVATQDDPSFQTLAYASASQGPATLSARSFAALRETRPWVRYVALLLLAAGAITVIAPIVTLVSAQREPPGPVMLVMLVQVAMGVLYVVSAVLLNTYGTRLGALVRSGGANEVDAALEAQRSFWKFNGILALVALILIGLVLVGVVIAIVYGIAMA